MDEILETSANEMVLVADIQFRPGQKIYFFDPGDLELNTGDHVIIDTARGAEFGICTGPCHKIPVKDVVSPLRKVLRKTTPQDEKVVSENRAKENKAFDICSHKIQAHGLDMQLVSAEYAFDGSKVLFYFTADERVDFRELVKDLASVFHNRIELRQIGVRDKAKMVGGLGICGRPFCCVSFLDDFQPVSIKMAKTQNLSLNPVKISGTCGRLMCCLKYEQDTYEYLISSLPKAESFVDTPEGRGTIVELDVLRQRVKVRMENAPETVNVFAAEDVAVLRSGKAKKTDPPIPTDLAPISGFGKRVKKEVTEEPQKLEPIRFKYSTESLVEEKTEPAAELTQNPAPQKQRRKPAEQPVQNKDPKPQREPREPAEPKERREPREPRERRDPRLPRKPKPAAEPKAAETAAEGAEETAEKKIFRRRNNFRHHRKPKPQTDGQNKTE